MNKNIINLAKLLAERDLLHVGMTVSAKIPVKTFGNIPVEKEKIGIVDSIDEQGIVAIYDGKNRKNTLFEDILTIEGMEVSRFAQAYKLKPNKKA
jgi:hypothetical protein